MADLISGRFVDREAGELEGDLVEVSEEDLKNYVQGHYGRLTSRQLAFLKSCEEDPLNEKWEARHADCIFVPPDAFFEFLFTHFPAWEPWEKNYQDLRDRVGPHPLTTLHLHLHLPQPQPEASALKS